MRFDEEEDSPSSLLETQHHFTSLDGLELRDELEDGEDTELQLDDKENEEEELTFSSPSFIETQKSFWNDPFFTVTLPRALKFALGAGGVLALMCFLVVVVSPHPIRSCTKAFLALLTVAILQFFALLAYLSIQLGGNFNPRRVVRIARRFVGRLKRGGVRSIELTTLDGTSSTSSPSSSTQIQSVDGEGLLLDNESPFNSPPSSPSSSSSSSPTSSPRKAPSLYSSSSSSSRCRQCCCSSGFWIRLINVILLLITMVLLVLVINFRDDSLPDETGFLRLPGLLDEATIERDDFGVIHIRAKNEHDMFFSQGVACAQERLWQMELQRRVGAGTLSAIVGEDALDVDKEFRTLGMYRVAQQDAVYLQENYPNEFLAVRAYVEGINAYLTSSPPLPLEFKLIGFKPSPWVPADVLVWQKLMSLDLNMNMFEEMSRLSLNITGKLTRERISQLWPDYPSDGPLILSSPYPPSTSRTRSKRTQGKFVDTFEFYEKFTPKSPSASSSSSASPSSSSPWFDVTALLRKNKRFAEFGHFSLLTDSSRASNNWVVSGKLTSTGLPLLANDPHLGFSVPSIWILFHLSSPTFEASGASFAGMPGVVIGRNKDIAWGVTNVGADVQDLYVMIPDPKDPTGSYLTYNEVSHKYVYRTEMIDIKDKEEPFQLIVKETIFGPVVSEIFSKLPVNEEVALRWTALDGNDTTLVAFDGINRAKNWAEYRSALRMMITPSQNFIFADTLGNIGYQCPGSIPIRNKGHTGLYPVASSGDYKWKEYIPFDELPFAFNPEEGFIVTANNKLVDNYKHLILGDPDWEEPYRAARIRQMIELKKNASEKITVDYMTTIQNDVTTLLFQELKPFLARLPLGEGLSPLVEWQQKLLEWDGSETTDSREALAFESWYMELSMLGTDETRTRKWENPTFLLSSLRNGDPACGGDASPSSCLTFAASAFTSAIYSRLPSYTSSSSPSSASTWGSLHLALFSHPILSSTPVGCLFDRSTPHGGDDYTVNVGGYDFDTLEQSGGPSYRQVLDISNWEASLFVHPMGQSGNVFSSHFDDLLPLWTKGQYLEMKSINYPSHATLTLLPEAEEPTS